MEVFLKIRYLILSDIHSNLRALWAVLKDASLCFDKIICLGDIVEFNHFPNQCIEIVQHMDFVVQGNHDYWVTVGTGQDLSAPPIRSENLEYLGNLPREIVMADEDFLLVHGNPADLQRHTLFIDSIWQARQAFLSFNEQVCFVGHSHFQKVFIFDEISNEIVLSSELTDNTHFTLRNSLRYIIDVGSVGQSEYVGGLNLPTTAAYVFYNSDSKEVVWRKISYME